MFSWQLAQYKHFHKDDDELFSKLQRYHTDSSSLDREKSLVKWIPCWENEKLSRNWNLSVWSLVNLHDASNVCKVHNSLKYQTMNTHILDFPIYAVDAGAATSDELDSHVVANNHLPTIWPLIHWLQSNKPTHIDFLYFHPK